MAAAARRRLDQELLRREMVESREQARTLIVSGHVTVNGAPTTKPARQVTPGDAIVVLQPPRFVGRGGHKLEGALDAFDLEVTGAVCLDVGSSTGGFTDALLQRGARSVVAVDVGTHQLHERLRADVRVDVREQTDIRSVAVEEMKPLADVVVCDVSFIGLDQVLPTMLALCTPTADLVLLIKPQFEAGRQEVSKGRGVIRDPAIWARVLEESAQAVHTFGGRVVQACVSPLKGGSGNVEFFFHVQPVSGDRFEADGAALVAGFDSEALAAAADDLP